MATPSGILTSSPVTTALFIGGKERQTAEKMAIADPAKPGVVVGAGQLSVGQNHVKGVREQRRQPVRMAIGGSHGPANADFLRAAPSMRSINFCVMSPRG